MGNKWELDLLGEGDSIKDLINNRSATPSKPARARKFKRHRNRI